MINSNNIEVNLLALRGSEAAFIDAHSGKVAHAIFSTFRTRACELTDASGYVHTLPINCEFKFSAKAQPSVTPPPLPSFSNLGEVEEIVPDKEPETVADEAITAPAVFQKSSDKKSLVAHFNKAVDGEVYKATIINKFGKPTEVSVKFVGERGIVWPYTSCSFEQGDLILDCRRN